MSATYQVEGIIILKVKIDGMYQCSQSSTYEEIAELVQDNLINKIGLCEVIGHKFKMECINR